MRLRIMQTADQLRKLAQDYRQLATEADNGTASNLLMLAEDCEAEADGLDAQPEA